MEAMKIDETPRESLMNSKSEWGNNSVPRVTINQEKDNDKDKGAGAGGTKRILNRMTVEPEGQSNKSKRSRNGNTQNSNGDWTPNQFSSNGQQKQISLTKLFGFSTGVVTKSRHDQMKEMNVKSE